MSVDGYVAGPEVSIEEPMGVGGERLHDWMFAEPPDPRIAAYLNEVRGGIGAVVIGRRTFDVGIGQWGDTPAPAPSFVVTHRARPDLPQASGTFTFVTDGVAAAIGLASDAAGDRDVLLMGADISRQALRAGLVDEVLIDVVPVVLGGGARLFDESLNAVTHLRGQPK